MADLLKAEARLGTCEPAAAIRAMATGFAERATVRWTGADAVVEAQRFGRMELRVEAAGLAVRLSCADATALSLAKLAAADALARVAGLSAENLAWTGDGAGPQPLPYFREMTVVDARPVTPRMRRVVLSGDAAHFASESLHARVLIPPRGRAPVWPHADAAGRTVWPSGPDALVPRVYTVRAVDTARGEIAIDVALHEGSVTPGASWARHAAPGDTVGLLGPGGAPFEPAPFSLFLGDETALPAIARLLEQLPATARAVVRLEVADAGEEQPLPSPAALDLRWLHRDGAAAGTTPLLEQAAADVALPGEPAEVRVFAGCEQAAARRLRAFFTREAGLEKSRMSIAAYWRLGHEGVDISQ